MKRFAAFLLSLLLLASGSFGQLAQTGGGLPTPPAGGGGGSDSVAVVTTVADYFVEGVNGTTAATDPDPSGSNRAVFGGVATIASGPPTIDDARYGGSGGTALTEIGTDETFGFSPASMSVFGIAPGPSGDTTMFGDWSGTPLMAFVGGVFLSGANQTTPFEGRTVCSGSDGGSVTTIAASCAVTGMTAGQKAVGLLMCNSESASADAITAVSGTTLLADQAFFFTGAMGYLYREASGSSVTLEGTCNQTSANAIGWKIIAVRINPA